MSALGEYYRGMGAAAMDQARASHESAAAQQTGADAQMVGQQGQAALHYAQAGMVKPLGESEIGLQGAQGGYYGQQGQAAIMHGQAAGVSAGASVTQAQAALIQARAAAAAAAKNAETNRLGTESEIGARSQGSGEFATGTSRVSAPGDGTVDTTKAKLANGEAVLNKGAAEHLGQPAIQALNAVGMLRMGMVPGQNTPPSKGGRDLYGDGAYDEPTRSFTGPGISTPNERGASGGKSPGYAKGTSKAGPKKAAKTDAKPAAKDAKSAPKNDKSGGGKPSDTPPIDQIDPKMLAAAMQMGLMGQQGGGMPPPGGAPQQMPQGAPMGMM